MLRFGSVSIDPPVVLAPMAGVTNMAFRQMCRKYGGGLFVSEMIAASGIVNRDAKTIKMLAFGESETVRSVQLYGVDPVNVGLATKVLVDEYGVDHIDMNFGCPAAKVTRKGGGAALPVRHRLFREIVRSAVGAAGDAPVTVKMRIGVDAAHTTVFTCGQIAQDEGVSAVALHARTAEQLYSGHADWTYIARLKNLLTAIPVLGNGDIWEAPDAVRMVAETGCDGVVVGRGCLGRPWLFADLENALAGLPVGPPPVLGTVVAAMKDHVRLLCDFHGGEFGVRDFRKHVSWYLTGYPIGGERRRTLALVSTLDELDGLLDDLDPQLTIEPNAYRATRGHTSGPRPVHLPQGWYASADELTPIEGADEAVSGG
jgi:nifR3 family TIM-barrel protein